MEDLGAKHKMIKQYLKEFKVLSKRFSFSVLQEEELHDSEPVYRQTVTVQVPSKKSLII